MVSVSKNQCVFYVGYNIGCVMAALVAAHFVDNDSF